jgi:Uma2 family endonuclease
MTAIAITPTEPIARLPEVSLPSRRGDPTWELVEQFPYQGEWTEEEYLAREFDGLVEFTDGVLEFLPMVTRRHQDIWEHLYDRLRDHVRPRKLGKVYSAPMKVRIRSGKHREPDVTFAGFDQLGPPDGPLQGARLVMEVVSGSVDDRVRDLIEKRQEYGSIGIPEYWIIDPETETITVLTLPAGKTEYAVHGEFKPGQQATSVLLPGFAVDVTACFAAGKGEA